MASIILGGLGKSIAGPLGGMLGGAFGSVIDNLLLNHKHINTPSWADLTVEAATMGLPIPPVYGRAKLAGNLIMSAPLSAEKHSGKGGLTSSKAYFAYNVTCAVAICRGPIRNIWRIFADSKLIWDMNPVPTITGNILVQSGFTPNGSVGGVATLYHYGTGKQSNEQFAGSTVNFYYGTEDQEPDAFMQVIAQDIYGSPDACPAYRGIAYAAFIGFPLADFGNRIPQFTFEVNGYGTPQNIVTEPPIGTPAVGGKVYFNPINNSIWTFNNSDLQIFNALSCAQITQADLDTDPIIVDALPAGSNGLVTDFSLSNAQGGPDQSVWFAGQTVPNGRGGSQGVIINYAINVGTVGAFQLSTGGSPNGVGSSIFCGSSGAYVVFDIGSSGHCVWQAYNTAIQSPPSLSGAPPTLDFLGFGDLHSVGFSGAPTSLSWCDSRQQLLALDGNNLVCAVLDFSGSAAGTPNMLAPVSLGPFSLSSFAAPAGDPYCVLWDPAANGFIFFNHTNAYFITDPTGSTIPSASLNFPATYAGLALADPITQGQQQLPQGEWVVLLSDHTIHYLTSATFADSGGSWSAAPAFLLPGEAASTSTFLFEPLGEGGLSYVFNDGVGYYTNPAGGPLSLEQIVEDICSDAGLPAGVLNASALAPTTVPGYAVTNPASARAALEPLQETFLFDIIETNFGLDCVLRLVQTQTVSITIDEADLGARAATAPQPGDNAKPKVVETVKQDFDLPQYIFFRYKTASGDFYVSDFSFDLATQYAKRAQATVGSTAHLTINSPICLPDSQAAQLVENILFIQYINRISVEFDLPIKYLQLDPGDVVDLSWTDTEGNTVSYPVYLQDVALGADNTLHCTGVATNSSVFLSRQPGQPQLHKTQPIAYGSPTFLQIAELPPLRDQDDDAGFYFGACPTNGATNWGAQIMQSVDGGESFQQIGSTIFPAAIGIAKTALGGAGAPMAGVWDTENSVTVALIGGGPLASVTPTQVLNNQNIFMVGGEVLGAVNVVQNADGSYTLSLLQRGIQGTDRLIGSHVAGERVLLLVNDGTIENEVMQVGQVGLSYLYSAISIGSNLGSSTKIQYALTGERIKPEMPCHAGVGRDSSNNATLSWTPRRRIGYQWSDGAEPGVDESPEAYSIDILSPTGAVVRTITAWTPVLATVGNTPSADTGVRQATYPIAQQTSDGLVSSGETWNPADEAGMTLSNGNLTAKNTGSGASGVRAITPATAGLFYFELMLQSLSNNNTAIGFCPVGHVLTSELIAAEHSIGARAVGGIFQDGVNLAPSFAGLVNNQWAGIAVNLNTGHAWFRSTPTSFWNGSGSANPATGAGGLTAPVLTGGSSAYPIFNSLDPGEQCVANFGATPFAGAVPLGFSFGFPGPGAPLITAHIYELSARVGRGYPASILG